MEKKNLIIHLTEKEKKIIEILRNMGYGEIKITVADYKPVVIEEIKKSIKL